MIDIPTRRIDHEGMGRIQKIHMVGVGGVGMGGIAEVLINLGYSVAGSDLKVTRISQRLQQLGASIHSGHHRDHLNDCDVVVVSSAVDELNPEVIAARELRIPVIPRAEMLAELMRFRYGIAVAGTHGKTTTTSLIASLLAEAGLDPTFVIGGRLNSAGANARLGAGRFLVAEADESDASFLYLQPMMAVITNIDADHMSTYGGDFNRLIAAFAEFLHHLPFYGLAVLCLDDARLQKLLPQISKPVLTYGTSENADIWAHDIKQSGLTTQFSVTRAGQTDRIALNLPGRHNVLNALAAIAVASELGVDDKAIFRGLANFAGIGRRFQVNTRNFADIGEILFVDDYGHHPREIDATLAAVRAGWTGRRVVMVFQPHRYSRTRDLFEDFVHILSQADVLLILEVYSAGEEAIGCADGRALCRAVRARGQVDPVFVAHLEELPKLLGGIILADDVVLTLGAGDIGSIAKVLAHKIEAALKENKR